MRKMKITEHGRKRVKSVEFARTIIGMERDMKADGFSTEKTTHGLLMYAALCFCANEDGVARGVSDEGVAEFISDNAPLLVQTLMDARAKGMGMTTEQFTAMLTGGVH